MYHPIPVGGGGVVRENSKKSKASNMPVRRVNTRSQRIEFPEGPLSKEVRRRLREKVESLRVVIEPRRNKSLEGLKVKLESLKSGTVTGSTDRYIFFTGDPSAIKKLGKDDLLELIFRVWLDKPISQHTFDWVQSLDDSLQSIKVDAVWRSFGALGKDIRWAVLDSGIKDNHPGFGENGAGTVVKEVDKTGEGTQPANFHGTHVAGIVGQIAPKISLESYKVLGVNGGTTSMIVRALHEIRMRNDKSLSRAHKLKVHGINMSLGGYPDVESYAVGWSPESREVARLARQGCVVVVSAGNDGYQQFATINRDQVQIFPNSVPASIGDPGVVEEAITVGSTHPKYPWRYGVSYFSSKGPTGDGRQKPDVVAPGEQIWSFNDKGGTEPATGTSMAAPHVSGVLALFLSQFTGFQGRAEEVKRLLLDSCSDLGRDPTFQGRGLVDAYRFFQSI